MNDNKISFKELCIDDNGKLNQLGALMVAFTLCIALNTLFNHKFENESKFKHSN